MKAEFVNSVIASTISVFAEMLGCSLTRGEPYVRKEGSPTYDVVGVVGVSGSVKGSILLHLSRGVALAAASAVLGRQAEEIDGNVNDVVAQLTNWIAAGIDSERNVALPGVVAGPSNQVEFSTRMTPLCIPFTCRWGVVTVEVAFIEQETDDDSRQLAADVLSAVHDLASQVAQGVGEHSTRVQEISDELTSSDGRNQDEVLAAVKKLIDANESMEKQLFDAEDKLQLQAQEIESHAAEARTDALTGLANRRAYDAEIALYVEDFQRNGTPVTLMMIDVDHFKRFNDHHGHQAGDEVLRRVARAVKESLGTTGAVARYGGEEFIAMFPGMTIAEATPYAERTRKAIYRAHVEFAGKRLRVTASAGMAQMVEGEDLDTFIRRADDALYASKEAGRNCQHWHDGQSSHLLDLSGDELLVPVQSVGTN